MTFSEAFVAMETGSSVTRASWDDAAMRLVYTAAYVPTADACVVLIDAGGPRNQYTATQDDLDATDWAIVDEA